MLHAELEIKDKQFAPVFGSRGSFSADFGSRIVIHTDDYNDLRNKPSIGGAELSGDMSLEDIGTKPYSATEKTKLAGIEDNAEVNAIETIKVNGTPVTPVNKAVEILVPTAVEDLSDADDYALKADLSAALTAEEIDEIIAAAEAAEEADNEQET